MTTAPYNRALRESRKAQNMREIRVWLSPSQSLKLDLLASERGKARQAVITDLIEKAKR